MRSVLVDAPEPRAAPDALALATALCERTGAELIPAPGAAAGSADLIVSERLPETAPAPLALAPAGLAARGVTLERIAVGHDGGRESALALSLGERLAQRVGASLTIVAVVEAGAARGPGADVDEEERLARHLERALAALPARIAASSQLLRGRAERALLEVGAATDLLVLGSRSHFGSTPRMRPGSVGAAVARSSPRPTLIAMA